MPLTANHSTAFRDAVKDGERLEVFTSYGSKSCNLVSVNEDSIVVENRSMGIVRMNGVLQEDIVTCVTTIPFDEIMSYTVLR